MNGKVKIGIYLSEAHDQRWIYSWMLTVLHSLPQEITEYQFCLSKMSPSFGIIDKFVRALGSEPKYVEKAEELFNRYGVSQHLKMHHLRLMLESQVLILSEGYVMDAYLDSLVKSYKPIILVMPKIGQPFSNQEMLAIKNSLPGGK